MNIYIHLHLHDNYISCSSWYLMVMPMGMVICCCWCSLMRVPRIYFYMRAIFRNIHIFILDILILYSDIDIPNRIFFDINI